MTLPYVEHQTTLSLDVLIGTAVEEEEIELVASEMNLEEAAEGDELFDISDKYDQFYESTVADISKLFGQPVFYGRMPDARKWANTLEIEPEFDKISVWSKDGKHIFLQYIWGDKDLPIIISLGAK